MGMVDQQAPGQLATLISTLGGPLISPADIEWAVDLPTGEKLLEWVAAQLQNVVVEGTDERWSRQAALYNIALEAGEVEMCVIIIFILLVEF